MSQMYWQCPDCPRTLSTADWTYADLADRGTPICGDCESDMELVNPSGGSGSDVAANAWIIVDTDGRSAAPCLYGNRKEAVANASKLDHSLIVGLVLPSQPSCQAPEEDQSEG